MEKKECPYKQICLLTIYFKARTKKFIKTICSTDQYLRCFHHGVWKDLDAKGEVNWGLVEAESG